MDIGGSLSIDTSGATDAATSAASSASGSFGKGAAEVGAGVASGAAMGAEIGTLIPIPGIGSAIGGAVGAVVGGIVSLGAVLGIGKTTTCYDFYGNQAPTCDHIDDYVAKQAIDFADRCWSAYFGNGGYVTDDAYNYVVNILVNGSDQTKPLDQPQQSLVLPKLEAVYNNYAAGAVTPTMAAAMAIIKQAVALEQLRTDTAQRMIDAGKAPPWTDPAWTKAKNITSNWEVPGVSHNGKAILAVKNPSDDWVYLDPIKFAAWHTKMTAPLLADSIGFPSTEQVLTSMKNIPVGIPASGLSGLVYDATKKQFVPSPGTTYHNAVVPTADLAKSVGKTYTPQVATKKTTPLGWAGLAAAAIGVVGGIYEGYRVTRR